MENNLIGVSVIILLLVINGFFVAAEFALVKAKSFRIESQVKRGSRTAELTLRIQRDLESYLAACQLGITMASLGLGWVGEPIVAAMLEPLFRLMHMPDQLVHPIAFLIGFIVFSSLHIVIGEQVPKTFAIRKPEPVSMWAAYPLHWFYTCMYPLNWILNKSSRAILSYFDIEEATHGDILTDEEIKGIIHHSEKHGDLNTSKANMLHNMFEFDTHSVEQIMVPKSAVEAIHLDADWETTMDLIRQSQHSRFPVVEDQTDAPIGIILVKDLYTAIIDQNNQSDPRAILRDCVREGLLVPETQPISNLFEAMRRTRTHMALAMDEYGAFSGVVTLEDILEEIVGEISDELDIDEPDELVTWAVDHWEADGLLSITDLERVVDVSFPDNLGANTITGLFMQKLSRMPQPNDFVEESGLRMVAVSIEKNRVGQVHIFPTEELNSGAEPGIADTQTKENGSEHCS